MKNIFKILFCLAIILMWADIADGQINLQRRYRHRKPRNIYLQDNSSDNETSIAAGFYGTITHFLVGDLPPIVFGATFKGSFHFTPKSYFDLGFGYMLRATNTVSIGIAGNNINIGQTISGFEILFLSGYDIFGSIEDDFSIGVTGGGSLMLLDYIASVKGADDMTNSFEQYFFNIGITSGYKAGVGQVKVDAMFAIPANTVNNQAIIVQINSAYLKLNLGYKIPF